MIGTKNNSLTLRLGGQLLTLGIPCAMGIINVTDDSFFEGSRCLAPDDILARACQIIAEGGVIIDIGAYSTRPCAADIPPHTEAERLCAAVGIVRRAFPQAIISVDTFRSGVVRRVVDMYGAVVVNDVSGGEADPKMFETIAELGVPYILMHSRGTPQTMQTLTRYNDLMGDIVYWFSHKIRHLHALGISDIILDPGFGFAKTTEQNFTLLARIGELSVFGLPILAGISRKSMVYKPLRASPADALNGTSVLHTIALQGGAAILRAHDVKEAVEAIRLVGQVF